MTALIPIEAGQWVLVYVQHFYPGYIDGDMAGSLERLVEGGSGWDCLRDASEQFDIIHVDRVMPKTFQDGEGARRPRYLVVAAASTAGEMLALRDKLFTIGFAADRAIEAETARLISDFAAKARADALGKVHAALPHIFGIVTDSLLQNLTIKEFCHVLLGTMECIRVPKGAERERSAGERRRCFDPSDLRRAGRPDDEGRDRKRAGPSGRHAAARPTRFPEDDGHLQWRTDRRRHRPDLRSRHAWSVVGCDRARIRNRAER